VIAMEIKINIHLIFDKLKYLTLNLMMY